MKRRHWNRRDDGGLTFTELGFGTAPVGNLYRAITDEEAAAVLDAAWQYGIRYFDTAPLYGLGVAERRVGRFLARKRREDFVLSTKVGRIMKVCRPEERTGIGKFFDTPSRREVFDYSYDGVMRAFEASFERTGLERCFDILFVHDLDVFTHGTREACDHHFAQFMSGGYQAMASLRDQGVVKAIGGGINEWEMCQTLAERGDFDLFLLAGRYTLLEQEALKSFLPMCEARKIGIVLGGPYNSGILATGPIAGAQYNYSDAPSEVLDKVRRIEQVCLKHNVALSDAALNFPFYHPAVVSVIPGGQTIDQVASNDRARNTPIPRELWEDLKSLGLIRVDAPVCEESSHGKC
ncbi:aldo/keto reductase [Rhizobium leguminosarum]|uniref:aldo/keto reductase n=1 Tax=Rhizobium leguminosarum TaxID=384 RepID=UPI001AE9E767|nr:aldo/keto reductase [Rhizobium leguminosarum]